VPVEPVLKKLAEDNKVQGLSNEELVHSEKLNRIVLKELQNAGKAGGLAGIEMIDGVVLADDEWTTANVSSSSAFNNYIPP
jgi:long-chain acyl-CoA synthetase